VALLRLEADEEVRAVWRAGMRSWAEGVLQLVRAASHCRLRLEPLGVSRGKEMAPLGHD
jgi:hypothetical protein